MRIRYVWVLLFLLSVAKADGQKGTRAQYYFDKGNYYRAKKNTEKAYDYLLSAIKENSAYDIAYSTLGTWYYDAHLFEKSGDIFATAAQNCNKGKERFAIPAARSYLMAQKPDTALYWLGLTNENKEVKKMRAQAFLLKKMLLQKDTNQVYNLGIRINSPQSEMYPSLSSDGQTFYFTRRVNGIDEDFFYAKPDSCGGWFTAKNMGSPPNTSAQEAAQMISADDHYLFFMRSDNRSENGWGRGGCDLYIAYRIAVDSSWSVPESFGATINTPAYEGMPSLSPDIKDLYFVSDRPGGYGGLDIWVSHFDFGLWQLPRNLGPEVNTAGNETAPFISSDNKTLYFASDGHLGLGGSDLFKSTKGADTSWNIAVNLGLPINSSFDETSIYVSPDGQKALFASDRNNIAGNFDIYETTLSQKNAPIATSFALCYLYDSISKTPTEYGSITLFDSTGKELAMYHSNRGNGSVQMSLPLHTTFKYLVRAIGYQPVEGTINFAEPCLNTCIFNFPLLSQSYVKPTNDSNLLTIAFPKNVTTLSDSQLVHLNAAFAYWKDKKDTKIFVNSYTDNTGTPLINEQKSALRAHVVLEELIKLGFAPDIITATGFGEANALVPNDSPENQDKNRRVELIIRW
jgi:outer membrane protein OmpA-like peptidoglycan-associated protein/tetratricopeptide (TPR) repeat protein